MNHQTIIAQFKQELILRGCSPCTIKSYLYNCIKLFEHCQKGPGEIAEADIKQYIHHLIRCGREPSTCNQIIYSLKSFFQWFYQSPSNPAQSLPRQKLPGKIPAILSRDEVESLLNSLNNLKHLTILALTYSAGLRLEEVRQLKIKDIDSKRMVIHVNGKGNKQRHSLLHQDTLELLRTYYKQYRPKEWLFEGRGGQRPLSRKSFDATIRKAKSRAGIKKKVSMHTLRHCFATHLLDSGVGLTVIQKILGHKNIKTTQVYAHVTDAMLSKVVSPIASLKLDAAPSTKGGRHA